MTTQNNQRRRFLQHAAKASLGMLTLPHLATSALPVTPLPGAIAGDVYAGSPRIRFSVIGINHSHIYGMSDAVIRGGGELVSFFAKEDDLAAAFSKRYPNAKRVADKKAILEDPSIQLVASAGIPVDRAPLGIEVMQHGKDYLSDKPGITTLGQLKQVRKVQAATGRIYSIMYSERFENRATVKAGDLVKEGAIGKVVQTIGLGPHKTNLNSRPDWFFDKKKFGGIITDIGSHQFDQFLFFTGSTSAKVLASQVGNVNHAQYPQFEDFGDVMLQGNNGAGYIRVDWFTPGGLQSWGDGRLTILGTDGYIEIRKNIDITHHNNGNHLYLVTQKETKYIDCNNVPLPFGIQLVDDVLNRTETAMSQAHCLLATELALLAQNRATTLKFA